MEYSISNIISTCYDFGHTSPSKVVSGIDLIKLGNVLNGIDYTAIRQRRNLYGRLYHEASISCQPRRGISFTDMLLMLAHHKLIIDRDALMYVALFPSILTLLTLIPSLKDLVVRTERNKLVTDLVNLDRVRSLMKMISFRRRFLVYKEQLRMSRMQQQGSLLLPVLRCYHHV
jgi:hypothetical protein